MHKNLLLVILSLFISIPVFGANLPSLFLFLGGDEANQHQKILKNTCVSGAQIIYSWKQLEPKKDVYDFSKIERDLKFLTKLKKRLVIQLQDRSFEPNIINVPDYIRYNPEYHGGVIQQYDNPGEDKPTSSGWVARVWDPAVRQRFQLLMRQLAFKFDGKIAGINLPETAVDLDFNHFPKDFTPDAYFNAVIENISELRKAFQHAKVIQYVNFFPGEWENDHHYMSRLFAFAEKNQIGLGGPDVVPYKKTHMQNSYPFFRLYKNKIVTAIAIQEPDYTYINPITKDFYHFSEFYEFSQNYLGAQIIFWNIQEPFYSQELAPKLNKNYFTCN